MARLLLLPACLGDTDPALVLPESYLSRMQHLRAFFVEDLRSARRFLRKIGYKVPFEEVLLMELNEHTRASCLEEVLRQQGISEEKLLSADMGVLSEAGLPCVADPGSLAVEWAHRKGVQVVPFSGPSSLFMALMATTSVIAILLLGKIAFIALKDYERQKKQGIKEPVFKASVLPKQDGVYWWKDNK